MLEETEGYTESKNNDELVAYTKIGSKLKEKLLVIKDT